MPNNSCMKTGRFEEGSAIIHAESKREGRKHGWAIGGHAEGSHRQCVARSFTTSRRCRKYALKGQALCKTHGGNGKNSRQNPSSRRHHLLKYATHMGETLSQRVEALAADSKPTESLRDELDLMRALAFDALTLYEAASSIEDENIRNQKRLVAGEFVREALNEIRDMSLAMVRIEKDSKNALDMVLINNVVHQVARIVDLSLHNFRGRIDIDPTIIADHIAEHMQKSIVVDSSTQGTRITPDDDVLAMDSTIPALPLIEDEGDDDAPIRSNERRTQLSNGSAV